MKKNFCIIGAGWYGLHLASELKKKYNVTIFEKEKSIFLGSSGFNQFRAHEGFHYPRSSKTIKEIKKNSMKFKKQSEFYNSFITPNLSYRFSPNKTKNMSDLDRRLDISNINSFNRLSVNDSIEGGHSITTNIGYKKNDLSGDEKISLEFAQVISDSPDENLPIKSTLNKRYSDIIGNFKFKVSDILNFDYDFMLDDGLSRSNYNSLKTTLSVNNLVTTFEYLEEGNIIGSNHYVGNQTVLKFNDNNSLEFKTRSNREIDMTEFYNLIYQYENDCLRAALEYNKNYYSDDDIKPEEEVLFSITIMPFTKINSQNLR